MKKILLTLVFLLTPFAVALAQKLTPQKIREIGNFYEDGKVLNISNLDVGNYTEIEFPEGITSIKGSLKNDLNIESIIFPLSLRVVEGYGPLGFSNKKLRQVVVPASALYTEDGEVPTRGSKLPIPVVFFQHLGAEVYIRDNYKISEDGTSVSLTTDAQPRLLYKVTKYNIEDYENSVRQQQEEVLGLVDKLAQPYRELAIRRKEESTQNNLKQLFVKMDSVAQKAGDLDLRVFLNELFPGKNSDINMGKDTTFKFSKFVIPSGIKSISSFDMGVKPILEIDTLVIPSTVTYLEPHDANRYVSDWGHHGVEFENVKVICYEGTSNLDWYTALNNSEGKIITSNGVKTMDELAAEVKKKYLASVKGSITSIQVTNNYVQNYTSGVRFDVSYNYSGVKSSRHKSIYLYVVVKGPYGEVAIKDTRIMLGGRYDSNSNKPQSGSKTFSFFVRDSGFNGEIGKTYTYTVDAELTACPWGIDVEDDVLSTKKRTFTKTVARRVISSTRR